MIPIIGEPIPLDSPNALLGEGPVWHRNALWWVDIEQGTLTRHKPGEEACKVATFQDTLGFVLPRSNGGWIAGIGNQVAWLDEAAVIQRSLPLPVSPLIRCNEAKVDPTGRLWVGTMARDAITTGQGALHRLDPDGTIHVMLSNLGISNGLAWSLDASRFYFIDSHRPEISVFPYDRRGHTLGKRSTLVEIQDGIPDGMTIDSAGHLWVALWGGYAVIRIDGSSGRVLGQIRLPVPHVTSCVFGGDDGATLFITTASTALNQEERIRHPDAGRVFYVRLPGITGTPANYTIL
jgi:hypothetical protein